VTEAQHARTTDIAIDLIISDLQPLKTLDEKRREEKEEIHGSFR